MDELYIEWNALEYKKQSHKPDWYWTVGAITLALVLAAFIFGNVLLGILILIGVTALLLQTLKRPRKIRFGISEDGVHIGESVHRFKDLESFSVGEETLHLRSIKKTSPYIAIPLPQTNRDDIRNVLREILPEEEHKETVADKVLEDLGF